MISAQLIRTLDPVSDLAAVEALYAEASEFWMMTDRTPPDRQKAVDFFHDTPPGCDPAASHRIGFFEHSDLNGVAELAFGFPEPNSAYLGLMVLAPKVRGRGLGKAFLAHVETLARARQCPQLFLAVLEENHAGRAFWESQGFRATGLSGHDAKTGHTLYRLVKTL